eukprot:Clim_evm110s210 gene=Clim_evmTU110s210
MAVGNALQGKLAIKVRLNGQHKRVILHSDDVAYDDLLLMVQRLYPKDVGANDELKLYYKDDEGDWINLESDDDLYVARTLDHRLYVDVHLAGDSASQDGAAGQQLEALQATLRNLEQAVLTAQQQMAALNPAVVANTIAMTPHMSAAAVAGSDATGVVTTQLPQEDLVAWLGQQQQQPAALQAAAASASDRSENAAESASTQPAETTQQAPLQQQQVSEQQVPQQQAIQKQQAPQLPPQQQPQGQQQQQPQPQQQPQQSQPPQQQQQAPMQQQVYQTAQGQYVSFPPPGTGHPRPLGPQGPRGPPLPPHHHHHGPPPPSAYHPPHPTTQAYRPPPPARTGSFGQGAPPPPPPHTHPAQYSYGQQQQQPQQQQQQQQPPPLPSKPS